MTQTTMRRRALINDLYMRSEELSGHTECSDDPEALVRALLREEYGEARRKDDAPVAPAPSVPTRAQPTARTLPDLAPQDEVDMTQNPHPEKQTEPVRESIAQILRAETAAQGADATPKKRFWHRSGEIEARHLMWLAAGLVVLLWPVATLVTVFAVTLSVVIAYVTLGPDRWMEILADRYDQLRDTNPDRAEALRRGVDRIAERFDRVLDYLPDAWADRLAFPDLARLDCTQDTRPDPFERLAREPRDI